MHKILFSSLLLTGLASSLQAQENQSDRSLELPDTLVTATRTEEPKNTLAAAATVYTRQDIERLQVKTLPELLRGSTGVDVVQSGGYGQVSSVFMRGTNADQVLVLVDGVRFGSATLGSSPFEMVPLDQIERVEIIRGPQSSLYGSEAMGGVIQIFTRKGAQEDKPSISMDAGGGSYHTHKESGNISGKWGNNWYSLGASNIESEGFSARQATPPPYGFYQPDHDGYQNTAMNARAGHRFDNKAEVEAFFTRAEGSNQFDANYGGDNLEFVKQVVGVSGNVDVIDNWHSTLRLGQSRDEFDTFFNNKSFDSRFNTTRWNETWLNEVTLTDAHKLLIGQDFFLDEVDSSAKYQESSRYNLGGFVEYRGRFFDDHFLTGSIRGDENEAFGAYLTGNISWRSNWAYGISTFASFGNAFKTPSFNDLYYPNYGNPNLAPEESTSVEAGLAGKHDYFGWELRAYHTNISNLITPVMNPVTYLYTAENIGKSQIDGLEAEVNTEFWGWNSKLSMTLLSPVNRETNAQLPRRSQKTLSFDLSKSFGPVDVGAFVLAQDHRYDNPGNTINVDGSVTVDLRSAYHINKNWLLSAKLNNLLDKNYQTVNTYNTADRNFFVSIHYNN
ncbi:MAG: TonB-dependent receptor [Methylococcales bacterium]